MRRLLILISAFVLIAGACSDDGDDGASDGTSGTTPAVTTQDTSAGGEVEAVETESLVITAVTFGADGSVTLTNIGREAVETGEFWLCNQPNYVQLPAGSLVPGDTVEVAAADLGGLPAQGAAAGLYSSDDFASSEAIVDYVQWGDGGGRASVAVEAGIWPTDDEAVVVAGAAIVAAGGGSSAGHWSAG